MAAITWASLQQTLQAIIARSTYPYLTVDGAFSVLFPQATSYAENRIYNDIQFLAQRAQDTSLVTTPGSRSIDLFGTFLPVTVVQRLALVTPTGTTLQTGVQVPFLPASVDLIDMYWPNQSLVQSPAASSACYWTTLGGYDQNDFTSPTLLIAPTPDQAYQIVVTGLFNQQPISATNPQTYLSTNYPELMISACMVFLSGALLRNYGSAGNPSQPDEPGMPINWEGQYERLKDIATLEELRRHQQGTDWLNRTPASAPHPPQQAGA